MSRLLLDEQPLLIMPKLACKIGLNESIILQQMHYWNQINEKSNNNHYDGYYWTFNTYEQWQEQFPFWSSKTIQRTITNLEKMGLVISGNYNKMKIDRTKWYRVNYVKLLDIENSPSGQNDLSTMTKSPVGEDNMSKAIPKTNPETSSKTNEKSLHHLSEINNVYVIAYLLIMKMYGYSHKRMNEDNFNYVINSMDMLRDYGITVDTWKQEVYSYFENEVLGSNNDGDILRFLKAGMRYFEIDFER